MIKWLSIGIGGFFGAILRYWLSGLVYSKFGSQFPGGTLLVNITGTFLLGVVMVLTESRFIIPAELKAAITIGILGAFTTFSTFCYESIALVQLGDFFRAFLNIIISVLIGLFAVWIGMKVGKII